MALPTPLNLNIFTSNIYTWLGRCLNCNNPNLQEPSLGLGAKLLNPKLYGPATSLPLQHLNLLALAT